MLKIRDFHGPYYTVRISLVTLPCVCPFVSYCAHNRDVNPICLLFCFETKLFICCVISKIEMISMISIRTLDFLLSESIESRCESRTRSNFGRFFKFRSGERDDFLSDIFRLASFYKMSLVYLPHWSTIIIILLTGSSSPGFLLLNSFAFPIP